MKRWENETTWQCLIIPVFLLMDGDDAEEGEKSTTTHIQQQLGKSLEGVLSVYEDMCNLKRVSL